MAMTCTERKQKQRASLHGYALDRECSWRCQGIIGATFTRYLELIVEQHSLCALCNVTPIDRTSPLDHDHAINDCYNVRGVLCQQCNLVLGQLENLKNITSVQFIENAYAYIENRKVAA